MSQKYVAFQFSSTSSEAKPNSHALVLDFRPVKMSLDEMFACNKIINLKLRIDGAEFITDRYVSDLR